MAAREIEKARRLREEAARVRAELGTVRAQLEADRTVRAAARDATPITRLVSKGAVYTDAAPEGEPEGGCW